ncbi:MAG: ribonuclease P protein component [Oleiphilus sp.]
MSADFTFPKDVRLLTASDYSNVFQDVQLRVSSKNFLILARDEGNEHSRLGIIIAKKNVKLAVERNRLKRQLRETFRQQRHALPALEIVLLAKRGADNNDSLSIAEELNFLWQKLKRKAAK